MQSDQMHFWQKTWTKSFSNHFLIITYVSKVSEAYKCAIFTSEFVMSQFIAGQELKLL